MFDENPFNILDEDLFDNMPTQLECTVPKCEQGDGGAKGKPRLSQRTMPSSTWRDMWQTPMVSMMVEVEPVVVVLGEGAKKDVVRKNLTFSSVNGKDI